MIQQDNCNLSELTSFQHKGIFQKVITFKTLSALTSFIQSKQPYIILGKGSNSIINPSSEIPTIIQLSHDLTPTTIDGNRLNVSSGTSINKLMSISQKEGLSGLEFCAGVPASVGGMVTMNFGCWGKSISTFVKHVHILTENGEEKWLSQKDMSFGYRDSIIQHQNWIILDACFSCKKEDSEKIKSTIKDNIQQRLLKQPLREPTFGSIFKNPPGDFAARILEELGLKGYKYKTIKLSEKHANFMVNLGEATYNDIIEFITFLKKIVLEKKRDCFGM